jgi:hypothetical protein
MTEDRPTVLHFGQAIRFRMWWLLPTAVLAGLAEIIGWSGRLWSSKNPLSLDPYLMQYVVTRRFAYVNADPVSQDHDYHHRTYASGRRELHHFGQGHPTSRTAVQPAQSQVV